MLTEKSHSPQNKTFIRETSPSVSYNLWDKYAIGGRRWDIATREKKVCDMDIEMRLS